MSESEQTTKTVVVKNDVHKAISRIADADSDSIQDTVDKILRDYEEVQDEIEILEKRGKL